MLRIIHEGEMIASYPDDTPFPSILILGFENRVPIHVVVAKKPGTGTCFVATAYRPDPDLWNNDFKMRRQP